MKETIKRFQAFIILQYNPCIVKSGIRSKITQNIYTTTSKDTEASAIMTA